MVKIEEGKFYKTRDGRKVGPVRFSKRGNKWATAEGFDDDYWYTQYNEHYFARSYANSSVEGEKPDDLISEWPSSEAGPIREVRRREIVPGVYGIICVGKGGYVWVNGAKHSPTELREAAHLFVQLAEVLEDGE